MIIKFPSIGSTMKNRVVIHIVEMALTIIYVFYIWTEYKGQDYMFIWFYSIGYFILNSTYCVLPAMKIACGVTDVRVHTWWRILLSNLPWCILTLIIILLFSSSLGYSACLPIVIPNSIYLLYLLIRRLLNNRKDENETS